jgi:hypothetical protein
MTLIYLKAILLLALFVVLVLALREVVRMNLRTMDEDNSMILKSILEVLHK